MSFANLVGKRVEKTVKFMGQDVKIAKLSVANINTIQEMSKGLEENPEKGFDILQAVISMSVEGASGISAEAFKDFPMDELTNLSNEIMKFSGVAGEKAGK